jgi:hypothetical protein
MWVEDFMVYNKEGAQLMILKEQELQTIVHIKCLVKGCKNYTDQGSFIGHLCSPCYNMLTTGKIGHGETFIHQLYEESCAKENK